MPTPTHPIPDLQPASIDIWDKKYRLKDKEGSPVDVSIDDTMNRVARALSSREKDKTRYYHEFLWAMKMGATPAGRILSNAGAKKYKPETSTINCTVSGQIKDSMDDILAKVHEAGLTLKAGCGIGYEFSTLRPKDAYVSGAGANTSGPLSFMDIYDKMCFTVSSAGGRRGAQMATFDVCHPDILEFIRAKRESGKFRQFNMSVLITNDFVKAVRNNDEWPLSFPVNRNEVGNEYDPNLDNTIIWRELAINDSDYFVNSEGLVACKIHKTIPAQRLWDIMMSSNYDYAEPGFILIDNANELNNNWFCEWVRACNPCGEQLLPPYGSCLLGSINLTRFIVKPFTEQASFNWSDFKKVVRIFTRMLDNVVEINGLPLSKQRDEINNKRRHGMGYLGLGSAITMLGMQYGDKDSVIFTEEVTKILAVEGWKEALALAEEKGMAPVLKQSFTVTPEMLRKRPEMVKDGYVIGDEVPGRILHAKYSRYMQRIAEIEPELVNQLAEKGARFTHHSSIAPTGTIALSFGNNVSNGIEPSFAHHYSRNIIREGKKTKEKVEVFSYELLAYREWINPNATPASTTPSECLPDYFSTSETITPKDHIAIQAAAQKWIDSSISKTINVPTEIPYDQFKNIYHDAFDNKLKGCTTFRFNPENFQGVLVKEVDLENTLYDFTLENGEVITVKGNDMIDYDGELHSAANLYDALREGYYGKF